ncbi:hypothetical protein CR513_34173, partial [Mucuna pruriens]
MGAELKRETLPIKVNMPEVEILKRYAKMFKGPNRYAFEARFGKILELLNIEVQKEAISALAQFYDPPMRCFLFRDFHMASMLEEHECILRRPRLGVPEVEVTKRRQQHSGVDGLLFLYLEERMCELAEVECWNTLADVLALSVYGFILLPHPNDYVDLAAIDTFLAVKERGLNPTMVVLANTYYSLQRCHDNRGG